MKSFRVTEILAQKMLDEYRNTYPHSTYFTTEEYPAQDQSKLGTIIELNVRDESEVSFYEIQNTPSSGRPEDDDPWAPIPPGPDDHETPYFYEDLPCKVLRFDAGEPHVLIACSEDYDFIVVGDTRTYTTEVLVYPPQFVNMIGQECHDRYNFIDEPMIKGVIVRQDAKYQSDGVIVESLAGYKRYILESECESVLLELPKDYDYVEEYPNPESIDLIRAIRDEAINF